MPSVVLCSTVDAKVLQPNNIHNGFNSVDSDLIEQQITERTRPFETDRA